MSPYNVSKNTGEKQLSVNVTHTAQELSATAVRASRGVPEHLEALKSILVSGSH